MEQASISDLNHECLEVIFSNLPPASLGACMAVNRRFRDFLKAEDELWRRQCQAVFSVSTPTGPEQRALNSYRDACGRWHLLCRRYGSHALRTIAAWNAIKAWLDEHIPEIASSLRPGASEEELDAAEHQLGVTLPPALRVLYRIHDGQDLQFDRHIDNQRPSMGPSVFHGLFGGYSFYSHAVSTRLMPLRRMVRWTQTIRESVDTVENHGRVLFASSFNFNKLVYCNTTNAEVEIGAVDKISCMPAISAGAQERRLDRDTPAADASGYAISSEPDTVLRWFEAYAAALTEGHFSVRELYREISHSKGICLYPERPPAMSEAITRGIRVRASPLFVPELSQLGTEGDERQYFFAYRIGFSLLPPGEQAQLAREARQQGGEEGGTHRADHLTQVQLLDRHWIIRNGAGRVQSQVRGEGVVGLFPILQPGGAEFLYQSCTHQPDPEGSMEGTFTFVEGTLENTTGDSIDAACPLFRLDMPPVIF